MPHTATTEKAGSSPRHSKQLLPRQTATTIATGNGNTHNKLQQEVQQLTAAQAATINPTNSNVQHSRQEQVPQELATTVTSGTRITNSKQQQQMQQPIVGRSADNIEMCDTHQQTQPRTQQAAAINTIGNDRPDEQHRFNTANTADNISCKNVMLSSHNRMQQASAILLRLRHSA